MNVLNPVSETIASVPTSLDAPLVDDTNSLINQAILTEQTQKQAQSLDANARDAMIKVQTGNNTKLVMEDLMVVTEEGGVPQISLEEETASIASQLDALIASSKTSASEKGILTLWRQALSANDNQGGDRIRARAKKWIEEHPIAPVMPAVMPDKATPTPQIDPNQRVNDMYRRGDI